MTPDKVANKACRAYVQDRTEFTGSNLFSHRRVVGKSPHSTTVYTVYSYNYHYPMFIYVDGVGWFENEDRYTLSNGDYSRSTERQRSHAHPLTDTTKLSTHAMKLLDDRGYTSLIEWRLHSHADIHH